MPGDKQTIHFKVKIENGAKPERYSLYSRMTAEELQPREYLCSILIEEKLA
jgi:hypothetical protein